MTDSTHVRDRLWSIVMADEEEAGSSLFVERRMGNRKPIPYCTVVGTRSLLQHTLDRADRLSRPEQRVTVTDRPRQKEAWKHLGGRHPGILISPPAFRGTAASVFLPLTYVRTREPDATVAVYPASHFVYPETRFLDAVEHAVCAVNRLADRVVLLGVFPEHVDEGYRWILPGRELCWTSSRQVRSVEGLREPFTPGDSGLEMLSGALWHTGIMTAKVETLWELGRRRFPQTMRLFERLGEAVGTMRENRTLEDIYQYLPIRSFFSDLLLSHSDHLAVIRMGGVLWSDWTNPIRIRETLERIGKEPLHPLPAVTPLSPAEADGGAALYARGKPAGRLHQLSRPAGTRE
jgi:mannose-1-phosphate guanylyltransferase